MATLFQHPLSSRVGRRIAGVVVAAALVPLASLGSLLFLRARTQLESQEQRWRLHELTKTTALNGLERLAMLEQALRWLAATADDGAAAARLARLPVLDDVGRVVLETPGGPAHALRGAESGPAVTPAARETLIGGGALLLRGGTAREYWITVGAPSGVVVKALVSMPAAFGYGAVSTLPARTAVCLLDTRGEVVDCSDDDVGAVMAGAWQALPSHGEGALDVRGEPQIVRTWALPLEQGYGAGTWTVAMLTPRAEAHETLRLLGRDVLLLAAASLLVVLLTVLAAVRHHLRPLAQLEAAAHRVSAHEFEVHLELATGDEFETLADGFNEMVAAIRRHVRELEAFSVGAATALARTIDAKSPWTSGHSERVTTMALRIGRAMHLAADDLVILNRGGLLHDIGKLATPPEILDKPGRLTPEERRIIEEHPRNGVRILEPIPDFAPLLPIVLQHHETFDGRGYPDGVAGEAIHPLARVLAVADVYDALRSDRPYRSGMPLAEVVTFIQERSGTQFDPVVVEAFMQVAAQLERAETPSDHELSDAHVA
ncbi:MAG: HD-GYP domain-containing protein [Vicinamibacterales bacterium]